MTSPDKTITPTATTQPPLTSTIPTQPAPQTTTLTVQEQPISSIPSNPLPTEYWTRPIYGENPNWYTIASNWLGTGSPQLATKYLPDAQGPQTSHIMWTKPLQSGGVVGTNDFQIAGDTYFEGTSRLTRYANPIIAAGKLVYTEPVATTGSSGPTTCVDLRTGEELWKRSDVPALSFAYVYDVQTPNNHGVIQPILFTANFAQAFDLDTGDPLFNVTNVPTGTSAMGPNGEQLRYVFMNAGTTQNPQWYLAQWNSSKLWEYNGNALSITNMTGSTATMTGGKLSGNIIVNAGITNPQSSSYRYDWNVTVPWLNVMGNQTWVTLNDLTQYQGYTTTGNKPTTNPDAANPVTVIAAFCGDILLCRNGSLPTSGLALSGISTTPYTYFAVNLNASKGTVGSILWMKTYDPPENNINVFQGGYNQENRVFVEYYKQTAQWVAYSMDSGERLWTTASQTALNAFEYYGNIRSGAAVATIAYGKLYSSGFGGICFCYDLSDGKLLWTYGNGGEGNSTNAEFNTGGQTYYPLFIDAVANEVVYLETTEHTIQTPIYKGALKRAINATDGSEIWTLSGYTGGGGGFPAYALADGYATWFNGYDNQIYVVGKGPSQTTITAPDTAVTIGQSIVLKGTVTDTSSGTTQDEQVARFPSGVPAASDSCMKEWMGYIYQQSTYPADFTGATVSLYVLDSNGNYRSIGAAQTDSTGLYSLKWTPDINGKYTVYAVFSGTNAYYGSQASTAFAADEQTATATPAATQPPTAADLYFIQQPAIAGLFIAIIAVGSLTLLMLKKKP